jgi:hypothetical protein
MIEQKLSLHTMVSQVPGNIISDMDGEKVMLSVTNSKYYNLGAVGGKIWDLIEKPISIINLVDGLTKIYEVDPKQCEQDVLDFLSQLLDERLIEVKMDSSG